MSLSSDFASSGTAIRATDFNANVASVRQATVSPGTGMLVDNVPMGGTIVTPLSQKRMIRSKEESKFIPFALRSVNVGSKASPSWKKIVYFPDGACDLIGGWAMCDNDVFDGAPVWSKTGDWYYIADSTGNPGSSHIPDQSQVENVYLHVLKAADGDEMVRSAIFTNSQLIPEDFNGYETDCICIGKFSCPTSAEISAGQMPRVLEQYVSGQVQVYGDLFPLKLTVVNIGTDADPEWVKAFWFSEGSVLYDGDIFAECHNKPYPGFTMGDEGLYFVANPQGSNTQVPLQEDVGYAFLHVKFIDGATPKCVAVVTNDDVTIPAEFAGTEDYCCCLGRFTCPSPAQVAAGVVPAVDQQFITSQVQVGVASTGSEDRPFKIKRINVGTEESPTWKTAVYIPAGAVQHNSTITGATIVNDCTPITGHTGWYECPNDSTHQGVYLQMVTGDNSTQTGGRSSTVLHFKLHNSSVQTGGWPSTTYAMTRYCVVALGSVDVSQNTAVTYGVAPINVNDDYLDMKWYHDGHGGGGGGGDGDKVVIDDKREDKSKPGVAIFDHEANIDNQHRVFFSIYDTLGVDKVVFGDEDGQGLADYLAGNLEVTTGGLGKNVNTENFVDECLTDTVDTESGDEDKAANGKHTHKFGQLTDDDGNSLSEPETLISMFSNIGIIHDPDDPTGSGEILTINDVGDSVSSLKADGTASAGSAAAGLALLDHVHPLNIGKTETTYAAGDHEHGVIDKDGVIDGACGQMVITDEDGKICVAENPIRFDLGLSDFDALSILFGELVYDDDNEVFKLPTSKLTYDESGHSGTCLLYIDENGDVHHSGNEMYTFLHDATEVQGATKLITDKDRISYDDVDVGTNNPLSNYFTSGLEIDASTVGGLTGQKWVITDSSGALTTTNDTPVALNSGNNGVLYATNGVLSFKTIGTLTGNVAAGDHSHGNITADGFMSDKYACFVTTDITGKVIQYLGNRESGGFNPGDVNSIVHLFDWTNESNPKLDDTNVYYGEGVTNVTSDTLGDDLDNLNDAVIRESQRDVADGFVGLDESGEIDYELISPLPSGSAFVKTDANGYLSICPEDEEPLVDDPDDPYLKESDVYGTGAVASDYIALMNGDGLLNLSDYTYQDLDDTYDAIFDEDGNVKVATLVPKSGDQGASQTYAPQNVLTYALGHTETVQEKIARCGTSTYAAREDHKHVLEACSAISSILTNEVCTVGLTNQVDGVGTVGNVQMFRVHTFMSQVSDDMMNIYYRPLKFDKYGRFIGLASEVLLCSSVWRG